MKGTSRIDWVDALKGSLIVLVVLGHAIQYSLPDDECYNVYLWNLIYSFHMPAFMAISGFLNYYNQSTNYTRFIRRRTFQLLIPYIIWSVFWVSIRDDIDYSDILINPGRLFWFLWALYIISLLFILAKITSQIIRIPLEMVVFSLSLFLVVIMVTTNLKLFGYNLISYYFLFYALGYFINKYGIMYSKQWLLALSFIIWFIMASFWKMHDLPPFLNGISWLPSSLLIYLYRFITAIIAIFFLFMFYSHYIDNRGIINQLCYLGKISLGIYVIHLILIIPFSKWAVLTNERNSVIEIAILLSFMVCICISVVFVTIIRKNRWTAKYLLGIF